MKTIASTVNLKLKVSSDELINKKWLCYTLLSKKVAEEEEKQGTGYKSFRTRLYNSCMCKKYNIETVAGIKCINVDKPMKSEPASLVIEFERV
jgi:hypothetical protein